MLEQLRLHIQTNFPELLNGKLLLAVSGGIDSIVLLHLCHSLGLNISVAHCNFKLRGEESNGDKLFVEAFAHKLGVEVYTIDFDTSVYAKQHKLSTQLAARELRYNWFDKLVKSENADYLLTAHHLDDSIETFFINLVRGTGIEGMIGIPEKNKYIRRPLLIFQREDIEFYAKKNHIVWREDRTNSQTKYLRNKIRKNIVPLLKVINPNFSNSFTNTVHNLKQADSLIKDAADIAYGNCIKTEPDKLIIDLNQLKKYSNPSAYLYQWLNVYGFTAWTDIENLIVAQSGKYIFSETHILLKNRDTFILSDKKAYLNKDNTEFKIYQDQKIEHPIKLGLDIVKSSKNNEITNNSFVIFVDSDKVDFPLVLRRPLQGDVFYPLGMKNKKKLSKFFKDEKMSQLEKKEVWLLCNQNEIVWVIAEKLNRLDDRYKLTSKTKTILKITQEI